MPNPFELTSDLSAGYRLREELRKTEKLVRWVELLEENQFNPPPLSKIRERVTLGMLARLEDFQSDRALGYPTAGVSPEGLSSPEELRKFKSLARDTLLKNLIIERAQRDALAQMEATEKYRWQNTEPLQRIRNLPGFHRTTRERGAVIAGILERERKKSIPLSRDQFNRAKAIAAANRYGK